MAVKVASVRSPTCMSAASSRTAFTLSVNVSSPTSAASKRAKVVRCISRNTAANTSCLDGK
ncbi:hypothetical protein D3C83_152610 [compost metagenome]